MDEENTTETTDEALDDLSYFDDADTDDTPAYTDSEGNEITAEEFEALNGHSAGNDTSVGEDTTEEETDSNAKADTEETTKDVFDTSYLNPDVKDIDLTLDEEKQAEVDKAIEAGHAMAEATAAQAAKNAAEGNELAYTGSDRDLLNAAIEAIKFGGTPLTEEEAERAATLVHNADGADIRGSDITSASRSGVASSDTTRASSSYATGEETDSRSLSDILNAAKETVTSDIAEKGETSTPGVSKADETEVLNALEEGRAPDSSVSATAIEAIVNTAKSSGAASDADIERWAAENLPGELAGRIARTLDYEEDGSPTEAGIEDTTTTTTDSEPSTTSTEETEAVTADDATDPEAVTTEETTVAEEDPTTEETTAEVEAISSGDGTSTTSDDKEEVSSDGESSDSDTVTYDSNGNETRAHDNNDGTTTTTYTDAMGHTTEVYSNGSVRITTDENGNQSVQILNSKGEWKSSTTLNATAINTIKGFVGDNYMSFIVNHPNWSRVIASLPGATSASRISDDIREGITHIQNGEIGSGIKSFCAATGWTALEVGMFVSTGINTTSLASSVMNSVGTSLASSAISYLKDNLNLSNSGDRAIFEEAEREAGNYSVDSDDESSSSTDASLKKIGFTSKKDDSTKEDEYNAGKKAQTNNVTSDMAKKIIRYSPYVRIAVKKW